jgi:hypothetical protein
VWEQHNPSFKIPTPLDEDIKTAAMCGALAIASACPMSSSCAAAKRAAPLFAASRLRSRYGDEKVANRIVRLGVGTARQKTVLE